MVSLKHLGYVLEIHDHKFILGLNDFVELNNAVAAANTAREQEGPSALEVLAKEINGGGKKEAPVLTFEDTPTCSLSDAICKDC